MSDTDVKSSVYLKGERVPHFRSLSDIEYREVPVTSDHDCLKVLRAHYSAYSGSAGIAAPICIDTGKFHGVFTGDADSSHMYVMSFQALFNHSFSFQTALSFKLGRR